MRTTPRRWLRWVLLAAIAVIASVSLQMVRAAPAQPDPAADVAIFQGGQIAGSSRNQTWALRCATDQEPTPTATLTPDPTAEPTVGPVDIPMSGLVYDAEVGTSAPVANARIVVPSCPPTPHQPFQTTTGADGRYSLVLPAEYFAPGCTIVLAVSAPDFEELVVEIPYEELRAQPERDFGLTPTVIVDSLPAYVPFALRGAEID